MSKEIENKKEQRKILALAREIEKMDAKSYDRFIKETVARVSSYYDKSKTEEIKLQQIVNSKTGRTLSEKDLATIMVANLLALGITGSAMGVYLGYNGDMALGGLIGYTGGALVSILTGIGTAFLVDENRLINKIKDMRARTLAKKANKLKLSGDNEMAALKGVSEQGQKGSTRGVAREILQGVSDMQESLESMDASELEA